MAGKALTSDNFSMHTGAKGGGELGRSRSWGKDADMLRKPDGADQHVQGFQVYKNPNLDENTYTKNGKGNAGLAKREGDSKSATPIKPRC